jgi:uncharacterized protein
MDKGPGVTRITDMQRKLEIAAVVMTGVGKFVFMDFLQWKFPFIVFAIISWTLYVLYQHKRTPGVLAYWGFTTTNFKAVLKIVLPVWYSGGGLLFRYRILFRHH